MQGLWRYNLRETTWSFYSDDHVAFNYSPGMIGTVLDVCEFDEETEDAIKRVSVDTDGALLIIKRRNSGKLVPMKRTCGTTLTEEEEAAAFAFASDADLFALSDGGVYEARMEGDR